jgi:hypothetical protein
MEQLGAALYSFCSWLIGTEPMFPARKALHRLGVSRWLAAAALTLAAAPAPAGPWGDMARQDLRAIHDVLAANHPGPVDPQNRFYGKWLKEGLVQAEARAESARTYGDYTRALRLYVNGFRDGHISLNLTMNHFLLAWPGFLVRRSEADGKVVVAAATERAGVPVGAELLGCDGKSVPQMMEERLDPFFWNRDIPHARWNSLPNLLVQQPSDEHLRMRSCTLRIDGVEREVPLRWFEEPRAAVTEHFAKLAPARPPLGLRQAGGVWFVTVPSFNYSGTAAEPIKALLEELRQKAPELRAGTVVLDVRGNGGGNSAWGTAVAAAIWGEGLVDRVSGSFDWTVDWRVSPANIAHLERIVAQNERDGLIDAARSWGKALDAMKAAHARGERLVRVPDPPKTFTSRAPANPVTGRVFLLTDGSCASACLDFVDIVRRLPRTTHIGQPTSADAVYIDNTYTILPSGLAGLSYSLKVYRNRVRGNNVWYDPHVRWPGGEMTEEALLRWIGSVRSAPQVAKTAGQ